jgi:hypothetical protein
MRERGVLFEDYRMNMIWVRLIRVGLKDNKKTKKIYELHK